MEKKRGNQVMAIAALFIAVIGLSLGFAAFSNTLTIKSSATVTPDALSAFDVNLSKVSGSTLAGASNKVVPTLTPNDYEDGTYNKLNFTATDAEIENFSTAGTSGSTNAEIRNLKANFTEPGQTVTYSFFARNDGKLVAYLNGVTFENVKDANSTIVCTVATKDKNGTDIPTDNRATQALVNTACAGISIKVTVNGVDYTGSVANGQASTTDKTIAITGTTGANDYVPVVVTITYAADPANEPGKYRVDGPMDVAFGNIVLTYGSVD